MRELGFDETLAVYGGQVGNPDVTQLGIGSAIRGGVLGNLVYDIGKAIVTAGVPSASSNTSNWGVVGPGSRANTDACSVDAVNGSDKQSDTYSGN